MHDAYYKTPNRGKLMDLDTGLVYDFTRPALEAGKTVTKWDVEVNDMVTFTLTNGSVTDVVLYKKHSDGIVRSYSSNS